MVNVSIHNSIQLTLYFHKCLTVPPDIPQVRFVHKKTREHIETVVLPVRQVFTNKLGFKEDKLRRPTFTVKGTCMCNYGMQQEVKLTESRIPEEGEVQEEEAPEEDEGEEEGEGDN